MLNYSARPNDLVVLQQSVNYNLMLNRFRGYYPVVLDIETAGFNATTDAMLEIAAVTLNMNEEGILSIGEKISFNIQPFLGANLDPASLKFTGIDINDAKRHAVDEHFAITEIFKLIRKEKKKYDCKKAIIVAHNATFDLSFLNSAITRNQIKRNPFHSFAMLDTATLAGVMLGQTVLAKACDTAKIDFNHKYAHSALYDAEKTAELFCLLVNHLKKIGGFPFSHQ